MSCALTKDMKVVSYCHKGTGQTAKLNLRLCNTNVSGLVNKGTAVITLLWEGRLLQVSSQIVLRFLRNYNEWQVYGYTELHYLVFDKKN